MNVKIEDEVEEVVDDIGDQLGKPAKAMEVVRRVGSRAVEISGEAGGQYARFGGSKDFCR
jgi:hypothetical protein